MKRNASITALFLDLGGVLLTNGWDQQARQRSAAKFKLDLAEMEDRHHLTFDTYEEGKLTLEEYLARVVFYQRRPFTRAEFRRFMFGQSKPYPEIENTPMFVQIADGLGIRSILHTDYRSTSAQLASLELQNV